MGPTRDGDTAEGVPVRLRDGSHKYVRWLGFAPEGSRDLLGGRVVGIKVESICLDAGPIPENWGEGGYIQGMLVERGVYGVLKDMVPVLSRLSHH